MAKKSPATRGPGLLVIVMLAVAALVWLLVGWFN
jgi:hypothetical protein